MTKRASTEQHASSRTSSIHLASHALYVAALQLSHQRHAHTLGLPTTGLCARLVTQWLESDDNLASGNLQATAHASP